MMVTNLMLAAALTGVHTPETSKLFERRIDPESGVVSYSLVYGAPDDNRQSLYFVTKSMTEDGRFLVFNYTKGNERKGRGPRKLMVADLLKDEVHELGDPGMIPFVDCKKDYIVYGRLKHNPGFYRQNLDDPGREIKLCDIPGALTEMGRVRYLATHLTLTRDRSKAFLDASVIAPNGATNYVQGLLTLANGAFESWGTTDFFCNHGQLNPVRDDLALCAWEEAWLKPGQDYKKKTGWYPRMWLVEPGGKRTLVPARDRNFASHEVWDDDGKGFSWCGRPGDYVYHHDLATGRQERWCGIAGARHNNVSPDNRYVVCDEAPEAWWRGCKWRVAFWNRETEKGVWIYSTRPALMPREKQSRLHPDPHPHFVMNGRYVVCTANNADGHMDLYVTPVDQLVKMTAP